MSRFVIQFSTDNAAFDNLDDGVVEVLESLAEDVREYGVESFVPNTTVIDRNGNRIGTAIWEK